MLPLIYFKMRGTKSIHDEALYVKVCLSYYFSVDALFNSGHSLFPSPDYTYNNTHAPFPFLLFPFLGESCFIGS